MLVKCSRARGERPPLGAVSESHYASDDWNPWEIALSQNKELETVYIVYIYLQWLRAPAENVMNASHYKVSERES